MKWLTPALMAEGPTDIRFFSSVFYRHVLELLIQRASEAVEVQEQVLDLSGKDRSVKVRVERICTAARSFHILGLHADASVSSRAQVLQNIIQPVIDGAAERCDFDAERIVAILPAREMEVWAMCDRNAIARCCGFDSWPQSREWPWSSTELESLPDPKRELNAIMARLMGGRRSRGLHVGSILDQLGQQIDLDLLLQLPSFRQFSADLARSLSRLHYIDA